MKPEAWRKITAITSLMIVLVILTVLSACASTEDVQLKTENTTEEAIAGATSTCVACHSNENLLKETVAPVEEEPEEPSGEG